jgi:hypothetical protein
MPWSAATTIHKSEVGKQRPPLDQRFINCRTVNDYISWLLMMGATFEVRSYLDTLLIKSNVHTLPREQPIPKEVPPKKGGIKKRKRT